MEHKASLEQISLQCNDLVTHNQEVEQAMAAACSKIPESVIPAELPIIDKIH